MFKSKAKSPAADFKVSATQLSVAESRQLARKSKNRAVLFTGLVLLAAGVVLVFVPAGAGVAGLLMRLWPLCLICAGIVRVMGFVIERKPRSPFGGMVLTIIGVLFLASRFHAQWNVLQLYGRYWILLLGVFAAVELLRYYSHRPADGLPPRLFSFGRILIIGLIVTSGVLANRIASQNPSLLSSLELLGIFGELRDSIVGEEYSFTDPAFVGARLLPGAKVTITNSHGDVKVIGGAADFRTTLTKGVRAWSQDNARFIAKQIQLQIEPTSEGWQVTTNREQYEQPLTTDLVVEVPSYVEISVTNSYGEVSVNQLERDLTVKSSYGRAQVGSIKGETRLLLSYSDAEVANISGAVKISGAKRARVSRISGNLELSASNSQVDIREITGTVNVDAPFCQINAQDIEQPADIRTQNGNVKIARAGDVTLAAPNSNVQVERLSGNLQVTSSQSEIKLAYIGGETHITAERSAVQGEELTGDVEIETSHAEVSVKNFRDGVRVQTSYRTVTLTTDTELAGDIRVENTNGEINLTLPQSSQFHFDAESEQGEVKQLGFDNLFQRARNSLFGALGFGPQVRLRTSYKTITLRASQMRQAQAGTRSNDRALVTAP